jgi:hypothetical protein
MAFKKTLDNNSCGKQCGETETSYLASSKAQWFNFFAKQSGNSSKG